MTDGDGLDASWVITHGAQMSWRYARSVQPALADMAAAVEAGNWQLCLEACVLALRGIVQCWQYGEGLSASPTEVELELRLALDPRPAAEALRAVPWTPTGGESEARAAVELVRRHDTELLSRLPFILPVIRTADGQAPTMRIAATIGRWRAERGMGPLDWNREGL